MEHWLIFSLFAFFVYGIANLVYKIGSDKLHPILVAFLVSVITVIVLLPFVFLKRSELVLDTNGVIVISAGAFIASFAFLAFFMALKSGEVSKVLPIINANVVLTVILGFLILKEPMTLKKILGVLFATGGILLLS